MNSKMEPDEQRKLMKDLTLALIFLSSWDEKGIAGTAIKRAWKGYDFGILDNLKEGDLIDFSYKAKSLGLTAEGEDTAKKVIERLREINKS